jgi:hypothetical protein
LTSRPSDAPHLARLEDTKEISLHARAHVPDFIEEDRPTVRLLEQAGPRAIRPR